MAVGRTFGRPRSLDRERREELGRGGEKAGKPTAVATSDLTFDSESSGQRTAGCETGDEDDSDAEDDDDSAATFAICATGVIDDERGRK